MNCAVPPPCSICPPPSQSLRFRRRAGSGSYPVCPQKCKLCRNLPHCPPNPPASCEDLWPACGPRETSANDGPSFRAGNSGGAPAGRSWATAMKVENSHQTVQTAGPLNVLPTYCAASIHGASPSKTAHAPWPLSQSQNLPAIARVLSSTYTPAPAPPCKPHFYPLRHGADSGLNIRRQGDRSVGSNGERAVASHAKGSRKDAADADRSSAPGVGHRVDRRALAPGGVKY